IARRDISHRIAVGKCHEEPPLVRTQQQRRGMGRGIDVALRGHQRYLAHHLPRAQIQFRHLRPIPQRAPRPSAIVVHHYTVGEARWTYLPTLRSKRCSTFPVRTFSSTASSERFSAIRSASPPSILTTASPAG